MASTPSHECSPEKARIREELRRFRESIEGLADMPENQARDLVDAAMGGLSPAMRHDLQDEVLKRPALDPLRLDVLFGNLSDDDFNIGYLAAHKLGEIAREDEQTREDLIGMLLAGNWRSRSNALRALAISQGLSNPLSPDETGFIPVNERVRGALVQICCEWENPHLAIDAAKYLGNTGPVSHDAIPVLLDNLRDVNQTDRDVYAYETLIQESACAVGNIAAGSKDKEIAARLASVIEGDHSVRTKVSCLEALGKLAPEAFLSVVNTIEKMNESDDERLSGAAWKIEQSVDFNTYYEAKEAAEPAPEPEGLRKVIAEIDQQVETFGAAEAFSRLGQVMLIEALAAEGNKEGVVARLRDALKIDNLVLQLAACEALTDIGREASSSAPEVCALLTHKDKTLAQAGALVLGVIQNTEPETVEAVLNVRTANHARLIKLAPHQFSKWGGQGTRPQMNAIIEVNQLIDTSLRVLDEAGDGCVTKVLAARVLAGQQIRECLAVLTSLEKTPPEILSVLKGMLGECTEETADLSDNILRALGGMPFSEELLDTLVDALPVNVSPKRHFALNSRSISTEAALRLKEFADRDEAAAVRIAAELESRLKAAAGPDDAVKYIKAIGTLGEKAASAAPSLIELFHTGEEGEKLLSPLADALSEMPEAALPGIERYKAALQSEKQESRLAAVEVLGAIATRSDAAVAALFQTASTDPSGDVRTRAHYKVVKQLPQDDQRRTDYLFEMLNQEVRSSLDYAASLLEAAESDPAIVKRLEEVLDGGNYRARWSIVSGIEIRKLQFPELTAAVVRILDIDPATADHGEQFLLSGAVGCAGTLGAKAAVPRLLELLNHFENPEDHYLNEIRGNAARAVGVLTSGSDIAVRPLLGLLQNRRGGAAIAAAASLGAIGPEAKGAVSELLNCVRDGHDDLKRAAAGALKAIAPGDPVVRHAVRDIR